MPNIRKKYSPTQTARSIGLTGRKKAATHTRCTAKKGMDPSQEMRSWVEIERAVEFTCEGAFQSRGHAEPGASSTHQHTVMSRQCQRAARSWTVASQASKRGRPRKNS